ncbi:MAG TPA: tetratricopeptide repeat protein [Planctomycetota bacterium]|nr:tetratricopeptide repeat protein [Planctomycetota bacterium]
MIARVHFCAVVLALLTSAAFSSTTETTVFDKGTDSPDEGNYKYKTISEQRAAAKKRHDAEMKKQAASIAYHIKTLKNPKADENDRATSAEYLGVLGAYVAVPDLIEVLKPSAKEKDSIMRAANGSLIKLTNKNYGVKGYEEWDSWWLKNKIEFLKDKSHEVSETDKIAAESENMHGLELMKMSEYGAALGHFNMAMEKNPQVLDYHNNAGLAMLQMGRPLDAIEYFSDAKGMNPDLPDPYMNIGRCYSRMDRTIEAQAWYKKASEMDKEGKLWANFWMIGKEYLKHSDFKMAYEYLDEARMKAEKQRVRDPRVYNDLAICHYGLDQYHSAWKELCNVRFLGYVPNPEFEAKVRKVLIDSGTDPDEEDRAAVEHMRELMNGEAAAPAEPAKRESIIDSVKEK